MAVKRRFEIKGNKETKITVHFDKSIKGTYFLNGHYPTKAAPDNNKKRVEFYNKGNLRKKLERLDRNNKQYKTITQLRKAIK